MENKFYFNIYPTEGGKDAKNFAFLMKQIIQRFMSLNNIKYKVIEDNLLSSEELINFSCLILSNSNLLLLQEGIYKLIRYSPYKSIPSRQTSWCHMKLIKIQDNDIKLLDKDIKKQFMPSNKKAGGQNLNHSNNAVLLTHIPTNIKVFSQDERNQSTNLINGMKLLQNKLNIFYYYKSSTNSLKHIRTICFNPKQYCKNHIINKLENLNDILDGKLLYDVQ